MLRLCQWLWKFWLESCLLLLIACLPLKIKTDENISLLKLLYYFDNLTICLLYPDAPLSQQLQRSLAREQWFQNPLVINTQLPTAAHYNRRSSTPLHNSKIMPNIDLTLLSLNMCLPLLCPVLQGFTRYCASYCVAPDPRYLLACWHHGQPVTVLLLIEEIRASFAFDPLCIDGCAAKSGFEVPFNLMLMQSQCHCFYFKTSQWFPFFRIYKSI